MASPPSASGDFWVPLESNPAALTKFAHRLGVNAKWVFTDCIGLDEELLAMSPQPVVALLFLFPYSKMCQFKAEERETLEKKGQNISPKVYFMKQLVGNACGTVAMVHCIANNRDRLGVADNSFFSQFLEKTRQVNPEERGKLFGSENKLAEISESIAKDESTQTEAPAADANVDSHFICFTEIDGHL
jgi:ubiquitin carboxyl-terminal hydrolase L3